MIQMEPEIVKCYFCNMEFIIRKGDKPNTMYGWCCLREQCIRDYLKKLNDDQTKIIREEI